MSVTVNERDPDERIVEIEVERLRDFRSHPFKVRSDQQMLQLMESISRYGILNPLIVRPVPEGVYEIISGHRRKYAAIQLGYRKLPVIIRFMRDDDAVINMIDSNLHREMIRPSEKAFAYRMKYEALRRKSGRKNGGQVDHHLIGKKTVQIMCEEAGESSKQIQRYLKLTDLMPDTRRILDSGKVTDHHAIIPTVEIGKAGTAKCREDEKKILALIASRLICAVSAPHVYESVRASFLCCGYTFSASGMSVKEEGWKAADTAMRRKLNAETENKDSGEENPAGRFQDLSSLYQGAQFADPGTKVTEHWTQPPKAYTEDTLLLAMEKAGTPEMESGVEKKGLGTPATRAGIIEKLVRSGYAERSRKQLSVTESGKMLVQVLPDYLRSAKMTADWENQLLMIERGQYEPAAFMAGIQQLVCRMVDDCRQIDDTEKTRFAGTAGQDPSGGRTKNTENREGRNAGSQRQSPGKCPVCGSPVYEGQKNFYCSDRSCRFTLWKENRFLDRLRTRLDEDKVKDLLACGRTTVKDLYSIKKDKTFTADLLMEWKDGRATYSLDFPERNKKN